MKIRLRMFLFVVLKALLSSFVYVDNMRTRIVIWISNMASRKALSGVPLIWATAVDGPGNT